MRVSREAVLRRVVSFPVTSKHRPPQLPSRTSIHPRDACDLVPDCTQALHAHAPARDAAFMPMCDHA
jgi:hypothetical protein